MKKISIIVPVYNVEKYLKNCLLSIFSQSVSVDAYEVIIVNDGTPDQSMAIVREFEEKYPNILVINQENKGLSSARNAGMVEAKGEYIWFIDSDDSITSVALCTIIGIIDKNPNIDIIATSINRIDEKTVGQSIQHTACNAEPNRIVSGVSFLESDNHIAPTQRFIYKKSYIDGINKKFVDGIVHEDIEFNIFALIDAEKILISDVAIYNYLVRSSGSIVSSYSIKRSNSLLQISTSFMASAINYRDLRKQRIFHKFAVFSATYSAVLAMKHRENPNVKVFISEKKSSINHMVLVSGLNSRNFKTFIKALLFVSSWSIYAMIMKGRI